MDRSYKPKKNNSILEKGSEPEVVLYNSETATVYIVNKTAFKIWKLSDGRHTIDDIVDKLKKSFNISDNSSIFSDIESTLAEFKTRGLIT
ncbi:PqqD family protein [bacterium]|nr:PqqD family protein [bacterium]